MRQGVLGRGTFIAKNSFEYVLLNVSKLGLILIIIAVCVTLKLNLKLLFGIVKWLV